MFASLFEERSERRCQSSSMLKCVYVCLVSRHSAARGVEFSAVAISYPFDNYSYSTTGTPTQRTEWMLNNTSYIVMLFWRVSDNCMLIFTRAGTKREKREKEILFEEEVNREVRDRWGYFHFFFIFRCVDEFFDLLEYQFRTHYGILHFAL